MLTVSGVTEWEGYGKATQQAALYSFIYCQAPGTGTGNGDWEGATQQAALCIHSFIHQVKYEMPEGG